MTSSTASPKILMFGDPHNQFDPIVQITKECRPHAIILLGDIEPTKNYDKLFSPILELGIPVYWITGNHDNPRSIFRRFPKDYCLDNRIVTIAGLKVAGYGWYGGSDQLKEGRADILVTHNAPKTSRYVVKFEERYGTGAYRNYRHSLHTRERTIDKDWIKARRSDKLAGGYSSRGDSFINMIAERLNVSAIFHGHYHDAQWVHRYKPNGYVCVSVSEYGVTDECGRFVRDQDIIGLKHNIERYLTGLTLSCDPPGREAEYKERLWNQYRWGTCALERKFR